MLQALGVAARTMVCEMRGGCRLSLLAATPLAAARLTFYQGAVEVVE